MNDKEKVIKLVLIIIGVFGLILKRSYTGEYIDFVRSYLGNFSISFAIFFLVEIGSKKLKLNNYVLALLSLSILELFELTNGFGIMQNVYDPYDLVVNFIGVGFAVIVNIVISKILLNFNL
ncbi:MAG: hypothetical protein V1773_18335 [bacterium]